MGWLPLSVGYRDLLAVGFYRVEFKCRAGNLYPEMSIIRFPVLCIAGRGGYDISVKVAGSTRLI